MTSRPVIPSRLRRALLLLHVWFWLWAVCLIVIVVASKVSSDPGTWFLLVVVGLLVGRVGFYVSLWRLTRALGKSPVVWVGACILTWPIGDLIAYASMAANPKEWTEEQKAVEESRIATNAQERR